MTMVIDLFVRSDALAFADVAVIMIRSTTAPNTSAPTRTISCGDCPGCAPHMPRVAIA